MTLDTIYEILEKIVNSDQPIRREDYFYYSGQIDFLKMVSSETTRDRLFELDEKLYQRYKRSKAETAE